MKELVASVRELVSILRTTDISHPELGTVNGFVEAATDLKRFLEYSDRLLGSTESYGDDLRPAFVEQSLTKLKQSSDQFVSAVTAIEALVSNGTNQANYPQQNKNNQARAKKIADDTEIA
ncbi:MAG: hypothetical protein WBD13_00380, partial [Burkholderiaceae bacterium]